ncbi:hypothetical protein BSZ19_03775 [Bradyrhizobium japonicum]|uniref:Uncharacterized protein n=1 Tax=Bradyrhizobium japonicum TaxID=375 RepID=A0A1Y2JZH2_BRAJP|nr:hypothetical protein BSZ19_03775 [Bradyrhizobium japonicum]
MAFLGPQLDLHRAVAASGNAYLKQFVTSSFTISPIEAACELRTQISSGDLPTRVERHSRSILTLASAARMTASSQSLVFKLNLISTGMPNPRYATGTRRRNQ